MEDSRSEEAVLTRHPATSNRTVNKEYKQREILECDVTYADKSGTNAAHGGVVETKRANVMRPRKIINVIPPRTFRESDFSQVVSSTTFESHHSAENSTSTSPLHTEDKSVQTFHLSRISAKQLYVLKNDFITCNF